MARRPRPTRIRTDKYRNRQDCALEVSELLRSIVLPMSRTYRLVVPILGSIIASSAAAQEAPRPANVDYTEMSIGDLLKIKVTSGSKHAQTLESVPAAITVITQDDIHRTGVRNLAEAMRLAPGVQVQELSDHYYAITIRGFNDPNLDGTFGDMILVLIDGRSIYSPFGSSVYWEIEDLILDDVDRIEVIRGSGGSLYGANAVNGVINIITKSAADTLGGLIVDSAGTLDKDSQAYRFGWKSGDNSFFRIYGKNRTDGAGQLADGSSANDGGTADELGFRSDFTFKRHGALMVQGSYNRFGIDEVNASNSGQPTIRDGITTSNLLARWTIDEKKEARTTIQLYYDLIDYPYTNASSTGTTWDFDLQRHEPRSSVGDATYGFGYRFMLNATTPGATEELIPKTRRDSISSLFAQDEFKIGHKGRLTIGAKLERNTFTGFELQPNIRYLFHVNDAQVIWAAISRAVRTPSQTELNDHFITAMDPAPTPGALPIAHVSFGNPALTSESLIASEVGYRIRASKRVSLDLATYYNIYSNLVYEVGGASFNSTQFGMPVTVEPTYIRSGDEGHVYGGELEVRWDMGNRMRLAAGYSYARQNQFSQGTSIDAPMQQINAHLSYDLGKSLNLDGMLYWYDAVPSFGAPQYTKLDLRVGWKLNQRTDLSFTGHDLLYSSHATFPGNDSIPRSADIKLTIHF